MKTTILKKFLSFLLPVVLGCNQVGAQIFANLYNFSGDDGLPYAGFVLSSNTLYGTTWYGDMIFAIHTDGTCFTNLHNFDGADGTAPGATLILSSNTLYGTTYGGTVFAINTDGTGFTNVYILASSNGGELRGSLVLSSNRLYGTAWFGPNYSPGTVFAVNTDGTDFTNLYDFTGGNDGGYPYCGLVLLSNRLYGTTYDGGVNDDGTVFVINTDGTDFTNLHEFDGNDGQHPVGTLVLSNNRLYGTTYTGGMGFDGDEFSGGGTIYAINTDGTCFTNLYELNGNNEGEQPYAGLILSSNTLYGTTVGYGSVFAINTDGTDFTNLCFIDGSQGNLLLSGNTLYGTTLEGGNNGGGTVFALSLGPIPLNMQNNRPDQKITWGNPAFSLETAATISGPWTTLTNASPYMINATNGQGFFQLVYTNNP